MIAILTAALFLSQQGDPAVYIKQMEAARDRKDYPLMERICREAIDRGHRIEYLVRSLSWSLCRQGRTEEGLRWAESNWTWNPSGASLVNYIDAALDDGQIASAQKAAKHLLSNRAHWGPNEAPSAEDAVHRASSKVFRLVWKAPSKKGEALAIPKPMNTLNQTLISWSATGCADQTEQVDKYGTPYVRAVADGDVIEVAAEVKLSPYSLKPLLKKAGAKSKGPGMDQFLSSKLAPKPSYELDPNLPQVQDVVRDFPKASAVQAAERMMEWINSNFTFVPPGSPPGIDKPAEVIERKGGHCEAITSVEVCLLRACGVPARMIRGQSAVRTDMSKSTQHTIIQFHLDGIGWVDWDYFKPKWKSRDDFVRLWVYNSIEDPETAPLSDFFGRAFQELKGYKHQLVRTTLD